MIPKSKVIVNKNYTGLNKHLIGEEGEFVSFTVGQPYPVMVYFKRLFQHEAFKENELNPIQGRITK